MLLMIEIMLAVLIITIPTTVVLVLVLYRDRPKSVSQASSTGSRTTFIPSVLPPQVRPMYTVEDPSIWWIELAGRHPAERAARLFSGHLVLGRTLPFEPSVDRLYVGEDSTISRDQCVLFSYGGALWALNLSGVNVTMLNGIQLNNPTALHPGDRITMGNTHMVFRAVRPYA